MQSLPDIPSELLQAAYDDAMSLKNDSRYKLHMSFWHEPQYKQPCLVCLAGAVMAKRLDADIARLIGPHNYAGPIADKLRAINQFRIGNIGGGIYGLLGPGYSTQVPSHFPYTSNWEVDVPHVIQLLQLFGL